MNIVVHKIDNGFIVEINENGVRKNIYCKTAAQVCKEIKRRFAPQNVVPF